MDNEDEVGGIAVPEMRTAEEWAELKGFAAPMIGHRENASYWKWAAARIRSKWPIGMELTEAAFDAAIAEVAAVEVKN